MSLFKKQLLEEIDRYSQPEHKPSRNNRKTYAINPVDAHNKPSLGKWLRSRNN